MSEKDQSVNNTEEDFNVETEDNQNDTNIENSVSNTIIVKLMLAIQKIIQKKVSRMKSQSLKILKLKELEKLANDNEEKIFKIIC